MMIPDDYESAKAHLDHLERQNRRANWVVAAIGLLTIIVMAGLAML